VRAAVIPFLSVASWLGVIQAAPASLAADGMATTVGVASVLGTLTVLVYRLGVWRQEMENTRGLGTRV
jgi:predicted Na+-dependent transporter